jgi:hypothetical protein
MLNIEVTDSLPTVRRGGGRPSEERKQIQDALKSGEVQVVKNIEAGNKYNALQQRIRQAALQMGLKVKIVYRKHDDNLSIGDLYFHGYTEDVVEVIEEEKAAKASVRRNVKDKVTA